MESKSFLPVVGVFTTFELAKTFLNDKNVERAKILFLLIKELNSEYTFQNEELFLMESWELKYNLSVNPLLDSQKSAELNLRIEALSKGEMDSSLKNFVNSKSKNIENSRVLWRPENFDLQIQELFENFSEYKAGYLRDYDIPHLKEFLKGTAGINLHHHHIAKLMENINAYPVIRTHIYHHLHLNFISDRNIPAKDKIPDAMQLKSASYFPVFVSHDGRHLEYANEINPDIELVNTKDWGIG